MLPAKRTLDHNVDDTIFFLFFRSGLLVISEIQYIKALLYLCEIKISKSANRYLFICVELNIFNILEYAAKGN